MFVSASIYLDALFLLIGDNSDRTRSLVKELLAAVDKDANKKDIITVDDDLITVYKGLIKTVIAENITQENQSAAKTLLLKLKSNEIMKSHPMERDLLTDVLTAAEPISANQIDEYLKRIRNMLISAEIDQTTRKIFARSRTISDIQDVNEQEAEISRLKSMLDTQLKAIESRQQSSEVKASESYISMSDSQSIQRALNTYMDRNVRGVIKTGLQGLNRSLGARGGIGLGETFVFAACSHHYKSGILISFMIWTPEYNEFIIEPNRKGLLYFVSLENETHHNLMIIFKTLYARVEQRDVDMGSLTTEYVVQWLEDYYKKFNIELFVDRFTPHEFSFGRFIKRYNAFVEMGYQMILFDLDYMSEARGIDPGDTISTQGQIQLIKENYLKFVNHAKGQGYALTTGHQLTKKAEELAGQHRYAVKKFNPSMMADSSDVHRIVDGLFFMHLETNVDGLKFLTMQNRKNRGNMETPEKDKFFAYPFSKYGIIDDVGGLPGYVTDIDAYGPKQGDSDGEIVEEAMF